MDLARISDLLELLSKHDIGEFDYKDGDVALRLRFAGPPAVTVAAAPAPVMVAAPAPAAAPVAAKAAAPAEDTSLLRVDAPMVGTFYRAPSPEAKAYASVGDTVKKGQVLCIIEAMKLMNEIEADVGGVVAEVCVENGKPVQFGQTLFKIRPA